MGFFKALHIVMTVVPLGTMSGSISVLLTQAAIPVDYLLSLIFTLSIMLTKGFCFRGNSDFPSSNEDQNFALPSMTAHPYDHQQIVEEHRDILNFSGIQTASHGITEKRKSCFEKAFYYSNILLTKLYYIPGWIITFFLMALGVVLALIVPFLPDANSLGENVACVFSEKTCQDSTITFFLAALPAGLYSLILHHTLEKYALGIPPLLLYAWVVPIQAIFGLLISPLGMHLQHPLQPFHNVSHELKGMQREISEGMLCIFAGKASSTDSFDSADSHSCEILLPLLLTSVVSCFLFHALTLAVLKHGTDLCLRICAATAVAISWICLLHFDFVSSGFDVHSLSTVSWYSKASLLLSLVGVLCSSSSNNPVDDTSSPHYVDEGYLA